MCVVPITLQQTFPLQTVTPHPTTLNTPDLSPPSLSPLLGLGLRSEPSVNKTHNSSHLPPSSHLHGHFANTNSEAWTVTGKEVSPMTTAAPEQRCPQTAFRCTIKQSGLWLDKGNVSHDRARGGEAPLNESRSDSCTHPHLQSHWRFEAARRNCHFISARNGARKWNGLPFSVPVFVFVCAYVSVVISRVSTGEKKKKNLSPGTFLVLNIPRPSSEARNYKNNTYIDTVVKLWVTRLYLELWLVFGDILEPQKDQINSAR